MRMSKVNENAASPASALQVQIGGTHYYSDYQPVELMERVGMFAACSFILKYVFRFKDKGGVSDLDKAEHCCLLLEQLGNNWYAYDKPQEFLRFLLANRQLDGAQIRAVLAIAAKDMDSLKESVHQCYMDNYHGQAGQKESEGQG